MAGLIALAHDADANRIEVDAERALRELLAATSQAEHDGLPLALLRELTNDARSFCRRSVLLAHAQDWPRGYPGDFELIERLLDASATGELGSLERALDQVTLNLPIVDQHRNKVRWQAELVRARLPGELKVLSIACGGSRDLMLIDPGLLERVDLVLMDLDADALALSERRLRPRVRRLSSIHGNVLRRVNRLKAQGPFDVILVGGLLDYLPERFASRLLGQAIAMLAPGGILGATNIALGNPYRHVLELITNWSLIERDASTMSALFGAHAGSVTLTRDQTHLTWLATVSV
jgi:hypothetical protein